MTFNTEAEFEEALVRLLVDEKGWVDGVISYPTEEDLIQNWAKILYENNRTIDRLGDYPLTSGEMQQILDQIRLLRTPLNLNGFINSGTVQITRDNEQDPYNFKKTISLKIFDRNEIAAGRTRYQIAQQPKFKTNNSIYPTRRGDFCLLINGMPVIHVELKKSGVAVSEAQFQIQKYLDQGVFTGLFSLVQFFVAMNPDECTYFANPGSADKFNQKFCFHWADADNRRIDRWDEVAQYFLSIPMAHQMIGFYTVADKTAQNLKIMRSYQVNAAAGISAQVSSMKWDGKSIYGGYVWQTTGSGKTMTSFKAAQLVANSRDADKVVFLMDRIELGLQSLREYKGFSDDTDTVQQTDSTDDLITKLKSPDSNMTLIVTSIQKMSRIKDDGSNSTDIEEINKKRIVFIVDECHRSVFGEMLSVIKHTFPKAIFFGFSGTPIMNMNKKKDSTTADVFGDELPGTRYTIADGLRDGNVLGFDSIPQPTYKDKDLREAVALDKAKAGSIEEALADEAKKKVYLHWMDQVAVPMGEEHDDEGHPLESIEGEIPESQYSEGKQGERHRGAVVDDILENWDSQSQCGKFHAILATSSIPEAIKYYKLLRETKLKVTAVFDPSDGNNEFSIEKIAGVTEIMTDYNNMYGTAFTATASSYFSFKKDVCARLSHKSQYLAIENEPEKCLDILIVVDQMLTGFDSKWLNTLYMDKFYKRSNIEMIIQAFSRTNRVFNEDKPHGIIRYYRRPYTMQKIIAYAFEQYSGHKALGVFVQKLRDNLLGMNSAYKDISEVFRLAGIDDFSRLPDAVEERREFAKLFRNLNRCLEPAKVQGFIWDELSYPFPEGDVALLFNEEVYNILLMRYKELRRGGEPGTDEPPYEIDSYLMALPTDKFDSKYMDALLSKYQKMIEDNATEEAKKEVIDALHKSFANLTQEQQKFANVILIDIQHRKLIPDPGESFIDIINRYQAREKNTQISEFSRKIGISEHALRTFMEHPVTEDNINEFERYDALIAKVDREVAKAYFERVEGQQLKARVVYTKLDQLLRRFLLSGGCYID